MKFKVYKYLFFYVLVILLLSFKAYANNIPSYSILANVNNNTIFKSDLDLRLQISKLFNPELNINNEDIQKLIFKQMVDELLITNDSSNYNLELSTDDVDQEIKYIEYINKWDQKTFENKIKASQINKEDIRKYLYNQALVKKFIEQLSYMGGAVSNKEVENEFYNVLSLNGKNQYLLSEIFVSSMNKPKSEALNQINSIYAALQKGANFSRMIDTSSDNIYDKSHAGEVGWVYETQINSDVKSALDALKKGQYTKPIFNNNGYYIYLLKDVKPILYIDPNDTNTVNQVKMMIRQKISGEKGRSVVNTYLENLYSHAIINYPTKL
ncbi:peptidylprolyl isomerase [Rickettsiales bacterium LUAb2]